MQIGYGERMTALPQKKLCWNCEGSVSKEISNCSYCGVYLHSSELETDEKWAPFYSPDSHEEEIPAPLYQTQTEEADDDTSQIERKSSPLFKEAKKELLSLSLLMMGSIFFLFGLILFLFSENGEFLLKWNGKNWIYFIFIGISSLLIGWRFLEQVEDK